MQSIDEGYVIFNKITKEYYCGLNKFDKQLRKAKIYHSMRYVKDALIECSKKQGLNNEAYSILKCRLEIVNERMLNLV